MSTPFNSVPAYLQFVVDTDPLSLTPASARLVCMSGNPKPLQRFTALDTSPTPLKRGVYERL